MPSDLITIPFPTRSSFWSADSESMVRVKDSTMWLAMILFSAPESAAAKITSPQIINGKFTLFFEYYIKLEGSKTRSRKKSLADVLCLLNYFFERRAVALCHSPHPQGPLRLRH